MQTNCNKLYGYLYHVIENTAYKLREDIFPELGEMQTNCNKLYGYLYHVIENTANQNTGKPLKTAVLRKVFLQTRRSLRDHVERYYG